MVAFPVFMGEEVVVGVLSLDDLATGHAPMAECHSGGRLSYHISYSSAYLHYKKRESKVAFPTELQKTRLNELAVLF
jgi:hypothetical protein